MATINTVHLIGRLTRDVEEKRTQSGKQVASFSLAVDGYNKDAPADFINCVAWGALVDILVKYTGKGKQIAVVGRLQTRKYTDKDGKDRYATEVVVRDMKLLSDPQGGTTTRSEAQPSAAEDMGEPIDLSGIPF